MHKRRDRLGNRHGRVKLLIGEALAHHRHQNIKGRFLVRQCLLPAAARKPPSLRDIYRMLGQPGKEKMHIQRFLSQTTFLGLLAACAADGPTTYAGTLIPQSGACDPPSRASLVKRGRDIAFTPAQGVLILVGQASPSGDIAAALTNPGADHKPYTLKLTATLTGPTIAGTYLTPRCRYAVRLTQAP